MGNIVVEIQSAESADDAEYMANRRAEMWAYFSQQVLDKKVEAIDDEETKRQLVAVKYKIVGGRLQLVPKDETRKALGRSPDDADTHVYGIWALSRIPDNVQGEVTGRDRQGQGERVSVEDNESMYINIK